MDLNAREGQCSCNTPTPSVDRTRDEELLITKFDYARARKAPGCFRDVVADELVKSFLPELIRASALKKNRIGGEEEREREIWRVHMRSLYSTQCNHQKIGQKARNVGLNI